MRGQGKSADGFHKSVAHVHVAVSVTVAFLAFRFRVFATGGRGGRGCGLADSRQCRGDTGNHRICGYSRCIWHRVVQPMVMWMRVGVRMVVMIQVRQRLL